MDKKTKAIKVALKHLKGEGTKFSDRTNIAVIQQLESAIENENLGKDFIEKMFHGTGIELHSAPFYEGENKSDKLVFMTIWENFVTFPENVPFEILQTFLLNELEEYHQWKGETRIKRGIKKLLDIK